MRFRDTVYADMAKARINEIKSSESMAAKATPEKADNDAQRQEPLVQLRRNAVFPADLGFTQSSRDAALQSHAVWQKLKNTFPDWYSELLSELQVFRGSEENENAIPALLAKRLVDLRRKLSIPALSSSAGHLQRVASSYMSMIAAVSNSSADCLKVISEGETALARMKLSNLQAQAFDGLLLATVDAVTAGRKSPQVHAAVTRSDYDYLTARLLRSGWTEKDFQTFSDSSQLARATPEKVCFLVQSWFRTQLAIEDDAIKVRLLRESLRSYFGG